jgi:two-component system cell cycle response regulator DivK
VKDASNFRSEPATTAGAFALSGRNGSARPVILLADYDRTGRQALAASLRQRDYIVHEAASGIEAIDAAELKQPDLILLDTRMPDTDGADAVSELKANSATARIPVIALGTLGLRGDQEKCRAAGAVDCLTKPLGAREVAEAIDRHLPQLPDRHASY